MEHVDATIFDLPELETTDVTITSLWSHGRALDPFRMSVQELLPGSSNAKQEAFEMMIVCAYRWFTPS